MGNKSSKMADLEKKLCELLHELPQKRGDFEKLHQCYNSELLRKRELKAEIDNLKTEVINLKTQLEFTNKALHKCEENYSSSRESAVTNKLNLDAATKTIDVIKDQATKLHTENVKLKKQIEELERDMKTESFFRESCTAKQTKTHTTIESLTVELCKECLKKNRFQILSSSNLRAKSRGKETVKERMAKKQKDESILATQINGDKNKSSDDDKQMRNLEKDYRDMERHANEAISIGKKSKLMLEHKDFTIAHLMMKSEESSAQLISLTSESRTLQSSLKEKKPEEQHYVKEILQEWQTAVNEMKARTTSYEKEQQALQQALQNALNGQSKFKNLEAASNERVKEIEAKLKNAEKMGKKNHTDCGVQTDLNISIDVACETTRPEIENISTQTDIDPPDDKQVSNVATEEQQVEYEQSTLKHSYSSTEPNTSMLSSNTLSALMSRYQMAIELPHQQEISDMAIQANNKVSTT